MLKNKRTGIVLVALLCLVSLISLKNKAYGDTIYFSGTTAAELQTAVNNASNGDVIVLQNNININNVIEIPANKNITITDNGTEIVLKRDPLYKSGSGIEYGQLGYFFYIPSTSTLNLKGTNIDTLVLDGNNVALDKRTNNSNAGFIAVYGTFNLYDGVVIKNCSCYSIGFHTIHAISVYGTFNMYGGVIKDNNLTGGAVDMRTAAGKFNMHGGVILNNANNYSSRDDDGSRDYGRGGGVYCERGIFNMYGGKVINNKAYEKGSEGYYGLCVNSATFNKTGGIISDNYTLISGIVLSGDATINVGQTIPLTATVSPASVTDKNLLWFSSNNIATVDKDGKVTGVSSGTVIITGAANDGSGVKATKTITVKATNITGITIEGDSKVSKGDIINLKAIILPSNASNKNLTWTSSNTNIATVNGTGLIGTVRGIEKGTVTITAAATDGSGVKSTKTITVENIFVSIETNCILLGSSVDYQTSYSDPENDPIYKYNYLYNHDANYYENSLGAIDKNNVLLDEPIRTFDRTGKYVIQHKIKDNPPTARYNENFANYRKDSNIVEKILYVHRKPIAVFALNDTTVIDNSYDLDHQSSPTKGIVKWEWNYIHPEGNIFTYIATSKISGENKVKEWLTNSGTNAKVFLRVQDVEGAWSDWSDDLPIADFIITYNPLLLNRQSQKIIDQSFDSKGLSLTYSWTVKKGAVTLFTSGLKDISSTLNTYINSNGTGIYEISLRVTNSAGQQSNIRTKNFDVISINNDAPIVNFDLVSNESPTWTFPKTINLHTLKYRPTNSFFHEEKTKFNVSVSDPNADNTGFIYDWILERFDVKNINNVSGAAANTYSYSTQYPFTNDFKGQGLPWGAYRVTLSVTDKPPIPPYQSADVKTTTVTKQYYIIPELSLSAEVESPGVEIMVGDIIKLKAKTSKETENIICSFDGENYTLGKVSEDNNFAYWEKKLTIPDSITESGTYQMQFIGSTTYGGNGNVTREIRDTVSLDIIALKLINFRINDIVNHPHITFPKTKDMLQAELIKYKAGYYVTFRIDSKGKPDNVYARVDIGNNGSVDQIINLTKVASGDTETWQGRFYTSAYLPDGTVISIKLDCNKGAITYDYNSKESWDGRSLIIKGSAFQDGRVNLTN